MIELPVMKVKFYRFLDHKEYEKYLTVHEQISEHLNHPPRHFHKIGTIDYTSLEANVIGGLTGLLRSADLDPKQENNIISIGGVEVVVEELIESKRIYHKQIGTVVIKEGLLRRPREHGLHLRFPIPELVGIVRYSGGVGDSLEGMRPVLDVLHSQKYDLHIVPKGTTTVGPRLELETLP